jgi:hypothetical protein
MIQGELNYGRRISFFFLKRLNQALDRRGANHNVSLAGNVLEVPAGDVVLVANSIGDEHKSNMVQNPL